MTVYHRMNGTNILHQLRNSSSPPPPQILLGFGHLDRVEGVVHTRVREPAPHVQPWITQPGYNTYGADPNHCTNVPAWIRIILLTSVVDMQ